MGLGSFITESNHIEGIYRAPTEEEYDYSRMFLNVPYLKLEDVCNIQKVYAPGMPIRDRLGMNVSVGYHIPQAGGPEVVEQLHNLLRWYNEGGTPWKNHVMFEVLHPFMDGNGRTGRILWAWNMFKIGEDPFSLPFLHRFYYQTLARMEQ